MIQYIQGLKLHTYSGGEISANTEVCRIHCGPNSPISIQAKGDAEFTLRVTQGDSEDGSTFDYDDFVIPVTGDSIEFDASGTLVIVEARTSTAVTPVIRTYGRGR